MRSHADRQPAAQIKFPRLQLVWKPLAAQGVKWRLQLFGHHFKGTPRQLIVTISIRGLMLWSAGAALAAYFTGTATLAWLWGRNPYNHITYTDLVLPTRWPDLRDKRGQGQIDEGIHDIRSGNYAGIMLLNHGLGLRPADYRGRMVLAQVYLSMGHMHRSAQLLEDGLVFGPPPKAYREALFRIANYLEDYESALKFAEVIEPQLKPDDATTRRWLLAQRVAALEKLQRYDEIERLRNSQKDSPSFALESAWARVQAVRGHPAEALQAIARDPGRFGVPADRCQLQLNLAASAHDAATARAAIQEWLKAEPTQPQPRVQEIVTLVQLGDTTAARDRLQRFFIFFSSDKTAVILLLKKLSELPDVAWLQAAHREAAESGALSIEARILYVQGLLMAGKVAEARTEFNLTTDLIEKAKAKDGGWSEGTRLLFDVITSDSPSNRSQFLEFFRSHRLTPEAFRFALRSLHHAKTPEVAGELSILARNRFPAFHDNALSVETTPVSSKHEEVSVAAFHNEAEARFELRRIDDDLQAGNVQSAFNRLKAVEQSGFTALQPELLTRRIRVHGALREQSELSGALQLYLASPDVSQAWLRSMAEQWAAENINASALTLARETYAKFPQAKWAAELLNLANPPKPTAAAIVPAPAKSTANIEPSTQPAEKPVALVRNEAEARAELRRIDEELAGGQYRRALDLIKAVERAKLASLQPELLLRRIQVHGSLNEQTELTAALGYYLSGKTVNQTALRNLATQWDNERQRDSALSLLRETLARFPQALWAHELRKKTEGDLLVAPEKNLIESEKK